MHLAWSNALLRLPIALLAIGVVSVFMASQQAQASIQGAVLGPDLSNQLLDPQSLSSEALDKTFKQLTESSDAAGAGASRPASRKLPTPWPATPDQSNENTPQYALLLGPSNSGSTTTTTTSSAGGVPGGASPAMLATAAPQLTDNSPTERYVTECTLFLPDAPANELLRPPQA